MLAPKCEFYLVLILVLLIENLTRCSGFHSLSNLSRATAESTFENDLLSKVHSRATRSDGNHSQINMDSSSKDCLTNRSLTADEVYKAKDSSNRKYVVVFDIDDCLCSGMSCKLDGMKKVKKPMKQFPECPVIRFEYEVYSQVFKHSTKEVYAYIFLPYLQILFEYLIDRGVRIAFFSAGIKQRNDEVVEELLKLYWGSEKYKILRSEGQFMTFSKDDLIRRYKYDPTDESVGECVKDLGRIIRDGETVSDAILVDDDYSYATRDQKPIIRVFYSHLSNETSNTIYYMLGLFKTYFENVEYRKLPLREGIGKIFSEHGIGEVMYSYTLTKNSLYTRLVSNGLSEVQKVVPKTRLYSDAYDLY